MCQKSESQFLKIQIRHNSIRNESLNCHKIVVGNGDQVCRHKKEAYNDTAKIVSFLSSSTEQFLECKTLLILISQKEPTIHNHLIKIY